MLDMQATLKGSLLEHFYPQGWDLARIKACCSHQPEEVSQRQGFWHEDFAPVSCRDVASFNMMMGHEMALEIARAGAQGIPLAMILPVGPIGIYEWAVYFLRAWRVSCRHLHCFNMDEWSDGQGNTPPADQAGSFEKAMLDVFYGPLGDLTVPAAQRHFATREALPRYQEQIAAVKAAGGRLITVFGIGRAFHVAFWEPHFAADYATPQEWERACYRIGAKLHPLTVEQNAIYSFKSNFTNVPCFANTIGPGLFLQSDRVIGGCDGVFERGASLQGASLWVTLRYGPTPWIASSYMPTLPGTLFYVEALAGPLTADVH